MVWGFTSKIFGTDSLSICASHDSWVRVQSNFEAPIQNFPQNSKKMGAKGALFRMARKKWKASPVPARNRLPVPLKAS